MTTSQLFERPILIMVDGVSGLLSSYSGLK